MPKRYLTLNRTQAEAEWQLKQQLRVYSPKGEVSDNTFKIYKRLPGFFHGSGILEVFFCFYGHYQQSGKCTYLEYRIRHGFSVLLMYIMISLLLLLTTYDVIFHHKPYGNVLILFAIFLFYFLIIQISKRKCIADFEKQLATDNPTNNRR